MAKICKVSMGTRLTRFGKGSSACSGSCAAWPGESVEGNDSVTASWGADRPQLTCWLFRGLSRLTGYAICVNIYAECVSNPFSMPFSLRSGRRSWRRPCSLRRNRGTCPNWLRISEPPPPAFSGNWKRWPIAAFWSARRMAGAPITGRRRPPPYSTSFVPCCRRLRGSFQSLTPNSPSLMGRLSGRRSMVPLRGGRSRPAVT